MMVPQKLNIEILHGPAIPFSDIDPKELKTGIQTSTATLFTTGRGGNDTTVHQ